MSARCEHGVMIDGMDCGDCRVEEIETLFVDNERLRTIEEAAKDVVYWRSVPISDGGRASFRKDIEALRAALETGETNDE